MSVKIRYDGKDRKVEDARAIQDIKEYLDGTFKNGTKTWELILVESGRAEQVGTSEAFQSLNIALDFAGIKGYPVHAIGRAYCRTAYKAWMEETGEFKLDADGFAVNVASPLEEKKHA